MSNFFSLFNKTARAIFAFILPILKSHAGSVLAVALPIAQEIVANLAKDGSIPTADKRGIARSQLTAALKSEAFMAAGEIANSTLNLAIEMAVARLKAN